MRPLRLLAFVTGLLLVVETVDQCGLGRLLSSVTGTDTGVVGVVRAAALGGSCPMRSTTYRLTSQVKPS